MPNVAVDPRSAGVETGPKIHARELEAYLKAKQISENAEKRRVYEAEKAAKKANKKPKAKPLSRRARAERQAYDIAIERQRYNGIEAIDL